MNLQKNDMKSDGVQPLQPLHFQKEELAQMSLRSGFMPTDDSAEVQKETPATPAPPQPTSPPSVPNDQKDKPIASDEIFESNSEIQVITWIGEARCPCLDQDALFYRSRCSLCT